MEVWFADTKKTTTTDHNHKQQLENHCIVYYLMVLFWQPENINNGDHHLIQCTVGVNGHE